MKTIYVTQMVQILYIDFRGLMWTYMCLVLRAKCQLVMYFLKKESVQSVEVYMVQNLD